MLSNSARRSLEVGLASLDAADELEAYLSPTAPFGKIRFLDTVNGVDNGNNTASARLPIKTITRLFEMLGDGDVAVLRGDIRGSYYAPLGVFGVRLIGWQFGRARHATEGGAVVDGNGCSWREAAAAENAPLLKLRQQGWELHNLVMIPESGYSAVQLRCAEDATDPDASHAIINRVRFISGGTRVGYGIEQVGGSAQLGVYNSWFTNLEYAYKPTSYGIRNDQDHEWFDNRFSGNKTDVAMNATRCEFRRNRFLTVYDGTTHPTTLNLANTGGDGTNRVVDNEFADAAADVTVAKGYKPGTSDVWRNRVSNTAADIVAVPT